MNVTLTPAKTEALATTRLAHTSVTVLQDSQEQTVKWTPMNVTLTPAKMEALATTRLVHTPATVLQDSQKQTVKWT